MAVELQPPSGRSACFAFANDCDTKHDDDVPAADNDASGLNLGLANAFADASSVDRNIHRMVWCAEGAIVHRLCFRRWCSVFGLGLVVILIVGSGCGVSKTEVEREGGAS